MITREDALKKLRIALNNPDANFRDGQWEAIEGVLNRRRQLVVQRTGWGKSMIYFLAAKLLREEGRGMTLLISPLLSLMRNQIESAKRVGIECDTINSANTKAWPEIKARVTSGETDILLVSPERLSNEEFCVEVLDSIKNDIGLVVVDEAHCVSDWGHDFRPDYKKVSRLLKMFPRNFPVLMTTATANDRVIRDIEALLGENVEISRGPLVRKSLYLQNIRLASQEQRLAWLAKILKAQIDGSGIIYALTTRDAEIVARWLRRNGIEAYAYFGDVEKPTDLNDALEEELVTTDFWINAKSGEQKNLYKEFLENLLLENRIKALVATSALGMGFDKSDLKFVIHYQRPKSVVDYYQQVGRAGRGVDFAYGVLMCGAEDNQIADYFIRTAFPPERVVKEILEKVGSSPNGLSLRQLQQLLNYSKGKTEEVFKFLMADEPSPVVEIQAGYRKNVNGDSQILRTGMRSRETLGCCRKILEVLDGCEDCLSKTQLCLALGVPEKQIENSINALRKDELVLYEDRKYCATLAFNNYQFPEENIRRLTRIRNEENEKMDEYVDLDTCLMDFLCKELDSTDEGQCGHCARCKPEMALPVEIDPVLEQSAAEFLNHTYLPINPRKQWADPKAAEEILGTTGRNIPKELLMCEGRVLSVYNSGGLGRLVHQGKYVTKKFDDRLVDACVKMLEEWNPNPRPAWVASIPSLRDANLVSDFAKRLAKKLGISYVPCLKKIKATEQQKHMENSVFQQNNLIDAFGVEGEIPTGNCLLVDDMVDSRWTLTIATAVLRKAGGEKVKVTPLALASTSKGDE